MHSCTGYWEDTFKARVSEQDAGGQGRHKIMPHQVEAEAAASILAARHNQLCRFGRKGHRHVYTEPDFHQPSQDHCPQCHHKRGAATAEVQHG